MSSSDAGLGTTNRGAPGSHPWPGSNASGFGLAAGGGDGDTFVGHGVDAASHPIEATRSSGVSSGDSAASKGPTIQSSIIQGPATRSNSKLARILSEVPSAALTPAVQAMS